MGLGQLIVTAGNQKPIPRRKLLVIPNTARLAKLVKEVHDNPLFNLLEIEIVLVDENGKIRLD